MSTAIIERIKKEIESLPKSGGLEETGAVISVSDGVAEIDGVAVIVREPPIVQ